MIRVAVTEDIKDYRELLKMLLNNTSGFTCACATASTEDAVQLLPESAPDIAVIDIGLPGKSGIELVKWIREKLPTVLCMICTAYDEDEKVFQALAAGAHAYILKSTAPADIMQALKDLHAGGSPMSSQVARKVVTTFRKTEPQKAGNLSTRETEVLELLGKGLLYKEVAARLEISIETVRCHCFNIYSKLHVNNRVEAINKFRGN